MSEFSDSLAAELNLATIGVVVEVVGNRLHAAGIADPQFVERFRAMTVPRTTQSSEPSSRTSSGPNPLRARPNPPRW